MNEEELLELKQRLDEAKSEVSRLEGQKTALLNQLKDEFHCSSIENAEKKMEKLNSDIDILDQEIADEMDQIETQLKENE